MLAFAGPGAALEGAFGSLRVCWLILLLQVTAALLAATVALALASIEQFAPFIHVRYLEGLPDECSIGIWNIEGYIEEKRIS